MNENTTPSLHMNYFPTKPVKGYLPPADPDVAYLLECLEGSHEFPNPTTLLRGLRTVDPGTYAHSQFVALGTQKALYRLGLVRYIPYGYRAALFHDVNKPEKPNIYRSLRKKGEMTEAERMAIRNDPLRVASLLQRIGCDDIGTYEFESRLIATTITIKKDDETPLQFDCIEPFRPGTNEFAVACVMEVVDEAVAMSETKNNGRNYRKEPMPLDEIPEIIRRQTVAPPEIIDAVMELMREALT